MAVLVGSFASVTSVRAQGSDPSTGRRLAEAECSGCHQIDPASTTPRPNSAAPSFIDISRMPSTNELAIKVFLRSSHPPMPDLILSRQEINSITAYILALSQK
ncbi:c-type cytochrome [Methylocapsa palsarum]|uniref:c-type cytochrome n=1 Tax=Methylocapsa palsarum TaxID=1612308 RepID=UPI000B83B497|nr:cytochrome c [Methylocapsa palsarum]